jgi:hypothetical protein
VIDIFGPLVTSSGLRRALIIVLFLLGVAIAAMLSSAAVRAQTQKCEGILWALVDYLFRPELYEKKCGCPNGLDFSFPCNSQYIPLVLR